MHLLLFGLIAVFLYFFGFRALSGVVSVTWCNWNYFGCVVVCALHINHASMESGVQIYTTQDGILLATSSASLSSIHGTALDDYDTMLQFEVHVWLHFLVAVLKCLYRWPLGTSLVSGLTYALKFLSQLYMPYSSLCQIGLLLCHTSYVPYFALCVLWGLIHWLCKGFLHMAIPVYNAHILDVSVWFLARGVMHMDVRSYILLPHYEAHGHCNPASAHHDASVPSPRIA